MCSRTKCFINPQTKTYWKYVLFKDKVLYKSINKDQLEVRFVQGQSAFSIHRQRSTGSMFCSRTKCFFNPQIQTNWKYVLFKDKVLYKFTDKAQLEVRFVQGHCALINPQTKSNWKYILFKDKVLYKSINKDQVEVCFVQGQSAS